MSYRNNITSSRESSRYVELVGMPLRQFETLVAVLAYHRVHGGWPSRRELLAFLNGKPHVAPLVMRGWLERRGNSNLNRVYAATDRAWRHLGVSRIREVESESAA